MAGRCAGDSSAARLRTKSKATFAGDCTKNPIIDRFSINLSDILITSRFGTEGEGRLVNRC